MKKNILYIFLTLLAMQSYGQFRFSKYYDNKTNSKIADLAQDFIQLPDSGYLFPVVSTAVFEVDTLGYAKTYLVIMRVNKYGDTLYQKVYRKPYYSIRLRNIAKMYDGNFLLVGNEFDLVKYDNDSTGSKITLVKINIDGDTLWTKTLDIGDGDEFTNKLINTNDGGFAIMGQVCDKKESNCDMYLMKLDSNANMEWYKTYTWAEGFWENPTSFIQTSIGDYVLTSSTKMTANRIVSAYVVKVSSSGVLKWQKKIDNEGNNYAYFEDVEEGANNSLLFAGVIGDNYPAYPITRGWIVRADTSGNFISNHKVGDINRYTFFYNIIETDKEIIVQGSTNNYSKEEYQARTLLYSFNKFMSKNWRRVFLDSLVENQVYLTYNMKRTTDGGYALIGFGRDPKASISSQDVWFVKVDSMGCLYDNCISLGQEIAYASEPSFGVYPNPTTDFVRIQTDAGIKRIELFDQQGRRVYKNDEYQEGAISLGHLTSGLYLLRAMDAEGKMYTDKIILKEK